MSETLFAPEVPQAGDQRLGELSTHVQKLMWWEDELERINEAQEKAAEEIKRLSTMVIPDLAAQLNISSLKMADGSKVEVKPFYAASISADRKSEAFKWLREQKHDSMIKNQVIIEFGKEQDKVALLIFERLKKYKLLIKYGVQPDHKETVHPQTLKAFVKESMENGRDIPQETLGVYVGKVTKVTRAK